MQFQSTTPGVLTWPLPLRQEEEFSLEMKSPPWLGWSLHIGLLTRKQQEKDESVWPEAFIERHGLYWKTQWGSLIEILFWSSIHSIIQTRQCLGPYPRILDVAMAVTKWLESHCIQMYGWGLGSPNMSGCGWCNWSPRMSGCSDDSAGRPCRPAGG